LPFGREKKLMLSNKKLVLLGTVLFLSVLVLLPSAVIGYGDSFGTAETKTIDTTYSEYLYSGDNYAYYKVSRTTGDYLWVKISWSSSLDDLDLRLYDPSQSLVVTSAGSGTSDSCGCSITTSGYWYIRVNRYSGTGGVTFTLSIKSAAPIPGFELLYAFFSIVVLMGIVAFYKSRKSILN